MHAAAGLVPHLQSSVTYLYFAVGLVAAGLMPYEVYFYSSGALEEGWKAPDDLRLNRINAILGFGLGGILSISLIAVAAQVFHPIGVQPEFLGTTMLGAQASLGTAGLLFAAGGVLFAVAGAAIDTCFSGAYTLAQFLGWEWGKYRIAQGAPRFTITWMVLLRPRPRDRLHRASTRDRHRVRRDRLGGRSAAHLPAGAADRERPRPTWDSTSTAASRRPWAGSTWV